MTRLATYAISTVNRPSLLSHTLGHIQRSFVPDSTWGLEIVVSAPTGDPGVAVARSWDRRPWPVVVTTGHGSDITRQRLRRTAATSGELVLLTGDDDLQMSGRLAKTIRAYEQGHSVIGFRRWLCANVRTRKLAKWEGPPHRAAATLALKASALRDAANHIDPVKGATGDMVLEDALRAEGHSMHATAYIDTTMVSVFHGGNVSSKVWPLPGATEKAGGFDVTGLGWNEGLAGMEAWTRDALEDLCQSV